MTYGDDLISVAVWLPVTLTSIVEPRRIRPMSKGLGVFALVLGCLGVVSCDSSSRDAGGAAATCPYLSNAEVKSAWGKESRVSYAQGGKAAGTHCLFSPVDVGVLGSIEVVVHDHDSTEDASLYMGAAAGVRGAVPVSGFGDEALFQVVTGIDGASGIEITVRAGKSVVMVTANNTPESGRPMLEQLTLKVLSGISQG